MWTCKRKAEPEAQLGDNEAGAVSLGGSVVASHSQVGTHGSIPPHSTIRQRINCRGAIFCARPSMPPPCCIPLSDSALNVRAQNIAPLQDGASLLGSGSITAIPSPASFAIHGSSASHRRSFFFGEADFFSAKRLFFRAARDVSGVRSNPPWARVEIKLKTSFQALSHSLSHERASALTSPPPDFLFISIHRAPPSHKPHHPTQK